MVEVATRRNPSEPGALPAKGRLRIAHVTATFPPYHGGTGNVAYHNALELARRGHAVTVFTASLGGGEPRDPSEVDVRRLPPLFRFGNAPCLPGLLQVRGFDIVHLHYPFYFGSEVMLLRSAIGAPRYVLTYHQDVLFTGPLQYVPAIHHRLLGRRVLERAAKVLATSWDYARVSRLRELMRTRPGSVDEMPNGVDVRRFRPRHDVGELRARYGLGADDRVVLFVGALDRGHYFKGVEVLLQALPYLSGDRVRLVVVGDGDLRSTYQQRAVRLGIRDRVTFCGRVPIDELPAHYALGDVLALPSTTRGEAFGLVLLEAMACGKPVVASNLPGVRTVVTDGRDGLLARPGDVRDLVAKIDTLLVDRERSMQMGMAGRRKVEERYDWRRIGARLEEVYFDVLHQSQVRHRPGRLVGWGGERP